jgi:hypothetical protein
VAAVDEALANRLATPLNTPLVFLNDRPRAQFGEPSFSMLMGRAFNPTPGNMAVVEIETPIRKGRGKCNMPRDRVLNCCFRARLR